LRNAKEMPKDGFKSEVKRHLTGKESEPWEVIYFKIYKSQLRIVEQALETAALMLGTDKSRGYCLEMICADFLAGENLQDTNPEALLLAVRHLMGMIPFEQRQHILQQGGATP
jgi:hypothetical protein